MQIEEFNKAIDASVLDVRESFGRYSWNGYVRMPIEASGQVKAALLNAIHIIELADRIRNAQKQVDKGGNGQAVVDAAAAYDKARE